MPDTILEEDTFKDAALNKPEKNHLSLQSLMYFAKMILDFSTLSEIKIVMRTSSSLVEIPEEMHMP